MPAARAWAFAQRHKRDEGQLPSSRRPAVLSAPCGEPSALSGAKTLAPIQLRQRAAEDITPDSTTPSSTAFRSSRKGMYYRSMRGPKERPSGSGNPQPDGQGLKVAECPSRIRPGIYGNVPVAERLSARLISSSSIPREGYNPCKAVTSLTRTPVRLLYHS